MKTQFLILLMLFTTLQSFSQKNLMYKSPKQIYKMELNDKELPNQKVEYGNYFIQLKEFQPEKDLGVIIIHNPDAAGYFQFNINNLITKDISEGLASYVFSIVANGHTDPKTLIISFTENDNIYYFAIVTIDRDEKNNKRTITNEYTNLEKQN